MNARFTIELTWQPRIGERAYTAELRDRLNKIYERGMNPRPIPLTELLGCDPMVMVDGGGQDVHDGRVKFEIEGTFDGFNKL